MKLLIKLSVFALFAGVIACSDFGDSKSNNKPTGGAPADGTAKPNPFDAGFDYKSGPFSQEKMLANIGIEIIAPQTSRFRLQAELLLNRVQDYCEALNTDDSVARKHEAAKAQWIETMLDYNKLEAVPLGPLSDKTLNIASNIYAYPYSNTCGVDIQVVRGDFDNISKIPFSSKGLTAIEYLLFEPELKHSCFRPHERVVAWQDLPAEQKAKERCAWTEAFAEELVGRAQQLEQIWIPTAGNYTKSLIDGSVYPDVKKATNALSDSLFGIESIKDQRLGKPLGIHKDCPADKASCPEQIEHPYANIAFEAQAEALKFFLRVFKGGQGFGVDDLLLANNSSSEAEFIENAVQTALATNIELRKNGSLTEQVLKMDRGACASTTLTDRKEELCAYQREVREVTNYLKVEVLMALSLDAPKALEGDND